MQSIPAISTSGGGSTTSSSSSSFPYEFKSNKEEARELDMRRSDPWRGLSGTAEEEGNNATENFRRVRRRAPATSVAAPRRAARPKMVSSDRPNQGRIRCRRRPFFCRARSVVAAPSSSLFLSSPLPPSTPPPPPPPPCVCRGVCFLFSFPSSLLPR